MMRSEFVGLLKAVSANTDVSDSDYEAIEHVYTYHPAIKDKMHIVNLYLDFGMTVIYDMVSRADKCKSLEEEIFEEERSLEALKTELSRLKFK